MQEQGLKSLFPMSEISLYGIFELIPHLFSILKRIQQTKQAIKNFKPNVVVTIDSPGFTLRIARYVKKLKIPVVHYVAPSVWALRPGRAKKLAQRVGVDHLLCLLPFEPPYFECHGLSTTFVGHPITEIDLPEDKNFRESLGFSREATLVCLLPGSRKSEIQNLLQIFLKTVEKLSQNRRIEVVLPTLPHLIPLIEPFIKNSTIPIKIVTTAQEKWKAFMQSSIALAASGTVSLELAYVGVPQVIAYKLSKLTYWIARLLVSTQYVSLVNILTKEMVVPELLQNECSVDILYKKLDGILSDSKLQKQTRQKYVEAINMLKIPQAKPSEIAASVIKKFL
jgi:lipid-A-disaccharide synthase